MLGTKRPSITSTCTQSADATLASSDASTAKSADKIDGAIFAARGLMICARAARRRSRRCRGGAASSAESARVDELAHFVGRLARGASANCGDSRRNDSTTASFSSGRSVQVL
jgi:hypothetical protein